MPEMHRAPTVRFVAPLSLLIVAATPLLAQNRAPSEKPVVKQASSKATPAKAAAGGFTIDQFLSPPSPLEMGAARKADRIAYVVYEKGMRNVYTAAGPDYKPVRITKFLDDDGVDVGSVRLSDDGSTAIFVRGHGQNRVGWIANPSHDPSGADRAVWAAKTNGRRCASEKTSTSFTLLHRGGFTRPWLCTPWSTANTWPLKYLQP